MSFKKLALFYLLSLILVFQSAHSDEVEDMLKELEEENTVRESVSLRGFADVGYRATEIDYDTSSIDNDGENSFVLGQLDLFLAGRVSEQVSFLNETVFKNNGHEWVLGVERVIISYEFNDMVKISGGRFHTAIGLWNQVYHHGAYLQTSIKRPEMYAFEGAGGTMPMHMMGLEVSGVFSSPKLDVAYVFNLGNGRGDHSRNVQSVGDINDNKAVNLYLDFGFEFGGQFNLGLNLYYDMLPSATDTNGGSRSKIEEAILAFHSKYVRNNFSLNFEVALISQDPDSGEVSSTLSSYLFATYKINKFTPFIKLDYIDYDDDKNSGYFGATEDNVFGTGQDHMGVSVGLRYEITESFAGKVEVGFVDKETANGTPKSTDGTETTFATQFSVSF
ncbi:MAG: hypothetical protein COA79_15650 [Planctomycetota bacterium]|nr:MAG: hypothetical protein COA79_15650 [Planctomycetota bacterium]